MTACSSANLTQKPSALVHKEKASSCKIQKPADNFPKAMALLQAVESSFLSQNCDKVLENIEALRRIKPYQAYQSYPKLVQLAVYSCEALKPNASRDLVKKNTNLIRELELSSPVISKSWYHKLLADLYIQQNEKNMAIEQKKMQKNTLSSQVQEILQINAELTKLDPSLVVESSATAITNENQFQTVEQMTIAASQLINNGDSEQALVILDKIPFSQRSQNILKLRQDAISNVVRNLRFKVRVLFERGQKLTGKPRSEAFNQAEEILQGIIKNYPEYSGLTSVQTNLKQVQLEKEKKTP